MKTNSQINDDSEMRKNWNLGSRVEVYSSSSGEWYPGDITRIFWDTEGEWLEVQYTIGRVMRMKQIPRDDVDAIRSYQRSEKTPTVNESNDDQKKGTEKTSLSPKVDVDDEPKPNDLDAEIRATWTRGSVVEVYSRGKKRWMRGMVSRVFADDEGEWLEIRYGTNLVKEIPRDSTDIRPLRARFKNNYTLTKDHINKLMAVCETVDLEGTRHLDSILLESVFRAFNLDLEVDELEKVFRWIDADNREAVTAEQFIAWLSDSVETLEQKEMQKRMFDSIDRTVRGELPMSQGLEEEERQKLLKAYGKEVEPKENSEINSEPNSTSESGFGVSITSTFLPAPLPTTPKSPTPSDVGDENETKKTEQNEIPKEIKEEVKNKKVEELGQMESSIMAEFSDKEDDDDVLGDLPSLKAANSQPNTKQVLSLEAKLEKLGLSGSYLTVLPTDEQHQYVSKIKQDKIDVHDKYLRRVMGEVQEYMRSRVEKAGVEGISMYDLAHFVQQKFPNFDRTNYVKGKNARFADFVNLTPGLVVLQIDTGNEAPERIAVTEGIARKINLKQKLEFLMTTLCNKTTINNDLTLILESGHDKHGRKLSVGEKLLTVQDFGARMAALGVELSELEADELFWAVAGNQAHLISQRDVGRFFGELVEELEQATETVVEAVPRVINLARMRYCGEKLWSNYIIKRCRKRWNNIVLLSVLDRRLRIRHMDMIMIPRTHSAHGEDLTAVQKSFHHMCHVLNKLQYNTVIRKLDHGSDKFSYSCITESPIVSSFPEMLLEAKKRSIGYSEHFVSQVIGSLMETVLFCHKLNCVNLNLNIDHLAFDSQLRPILLDFSRTVILEPQQKIHQITSMTSSTPPELTLFLGVDKSDMNISLDGKMLRKVDAWRVGVLLYALVTGTLPFVASTLQNFITQLLGQMPVIPISEINCSQHLKNLLTKLLEPTYFKRIDIQEALQDVWFKIASKDLLPVDVYSKIQNLDRIEAARNWISAITHKGYDLPNHMERDRKYFLRLDATGQRQKLTHDTLLIFVQDRLGYCLFKARELIEELSKKTKKTQWTWQDFEEYYRAWDLAKNPTMLVVNAIFRGLDPEGVGAVRSSLLLALFNDINLSMKPVINKIESQQEMKFSEVYDGLKKAIDEGFDILELLSVDIIVKAVN